MSDTKHTPTPWTYDQAESNGSFWIITDKETWVPRIAQVPNYDGMPNVANAAFIVKAVNNHDKLVEALRMCVDRMDGEYGFDGPEMDAARAALTSLD